MTKPYTTVAFIYLTKMNKRRYRFYFNDKATYRTFEMYKCIVVLGISPTSDQNNQT